MSTFNLKNPEILKLAQNFPNLDNKDFYIAYLYEQCETNEDREVIYRIMSKSMQNNSVIRIRNYFISTHQVNKTDLAKCKDKQEEIRIERQNDTHGFFDAVKRFFKKL